tara:strand:+ start:1337 stop:1642 length:306 start_codon:yes stop_codon:yes gene_type:complete
MFLAIALKLGGATPPCPRGMIWIGREGTSVKRLAAKTHLPLQFRECTVGMNSIEITPPLKTDSGRMKVKEVSDLLLSRPVRDVGNFAAPTTTMLVCPTMLS